MKSGTKVGAAASSVVAAVFLTTAKLVVGISTGSLGILAEAAHSALDLAAAVMTLFAVRIAARPADRTHHYGHGKVENLSALFETLLLLATCAWIIREAIERLATGHTDIEVTFWSFAVMITSIVVDATRSRVLYRAAREHNSQALEADALHFSTDIWSSAVVILGLLSMIASSRSANLAFLRRADAFAAIAVALITLLVLSRLGIRTIRALIDSAPPGVEQRIVAAVEALPGVADCHQVRVRASGAQTFVDVHVSMDPRQTLFQAHLLTEEVEQAISKVVPGADITVHPEPLIRKAAQ